MKRAHGRGLHGAFALTLLSLALPVSCASPSVRSPARRLLVSPDSLYVSADGRWEVQPDLVDAALPVYPDNTVHIECYLSRGACIESRANLTYEPLDGRELLTHASELAIVSSSDGIVVARAIVGVYDTEVRIDLRSQDVRRTARWREPADRDGPQRSASWALK